MTDKSSPPFATSHASVDRLAEVECQILSGEWTADTIGMLIAELKSKPEDATDKGMLALCELALKGLSVPSEIVPLAHTDHPLRHFDRTCDACVAEEVLTVLRDAGFHDAADFLLGKRVNVAAPSAIRENADTARMDWLETQGMIGIHHEGYGDYTYYAGEAFEPLREAVDAAMKKESK